MGKRFLTDSLLLTVFLLGALSLGWVVPPAAANDVVAAEMQPLDDEIEQLQAVLAEIDRLGQDRVTQLSRWIGWWTKIKELATQTGDEMLKDFDERISTAEKAQGLLSSLSNSSPPNRRSIPRLGWHDTVTIGQLIYTLKQERAKWADLIGKAKAQWHIAAVGWITGEGIQKAIDDFEKQIRDINQGIRDGTFQVHIVGMGWVTGEPLRKRIAAIEKQKQAIRDKISAGDYEVVIPGLGKRTRKTLEAEIAGVEAELAKRRETATKGDMVIHRPPVSWQSRTQLEATLDADAKSYEIMKKTVSDGVYSVWIVQTGWAKRVDLEGQVKSYEETLAKTREALAAGDYHAELPVGWATANQIQKALEELGKRLEQPNLDAKAREAIAKQIEAHQKSLTELQAISAYDIAIITLEKLKVASIVTNIMKLARPDFERRELVRTEREETLDEYSIESELWIKPIEQRLARLRQARAWIPGGE